MGSDSYVYRSIIVLNGDTFQPITSLGYNVTITKVTVLYKSDYNTSYTFNIAGFGANLKYPNDAGADWNAIKDDSVFINGNNLAYGTGSFVGNDSLKNVIQHYLDSGDYSKSIILGAFSNDEDNNQSYAQINYVHLKIVYQRPASTVNATVRNDFHGQDGGQVGMGINNSAVSYNSPKSFSALEGQTLNLAAYDHQTVGGYEWVFNNTEAPSNKSTWQWRKQGQTTKNISNNQSASHTLVAKDDGATFADVQRALYDVSRNDKTLFGTTSAGQVATVVEGNTDSLGAPASKTQNGKTLYFAGWKDLPNGLYSTNPRAITPTDNTTYTALYKGHQITNNANAYSGNSQRKLIETKSGSATWLTQVYTSMGYVWIEHSSDGGQSWTIGNNGRPLGAGKNPSIALTTDATPYNYIGVVWQASSGSHYVIKGQTFNQSKNTSMVPSTYGIVETLFTEPSDAYSVDANPNLVLTQGAAGDYFITFERKSTSGSLQPGINWLVGQIKDSGTQAADQNFELPEDQGLVTGTDANTTHVQMSVDPNSGADVTVNLILQQGSPGKIYSHYIFLTHGTNWSYTQGNDGEVSYDSNVNLYPSIVTTSDTPNNYYSACWIELYQMVYFSLGTDVRYYYGNFAQSCSIGRGGNNDFNSGFAVWSQDPSSGWSNHSVRFNNGTPDNSTKQTLSTAGKYVQAGNAATSDLSNMYVSAFYPSASPYYFKTSGTLGPTSGQAAPAKTPGPIVQSAAGTSGQSNTQTAEGRGFIIKDGATSFRYRLGNVKVDGTYIDFVNAPDTSNYSNLAVLNKALVTQPFRITANSKVSYSQSSGFADSSAAGAALGKNGYIHYQVELTDNATGKVLRILKDGKVTASQVSGFPEKRDPSKAPSRSLNTNGLSGKRVRIKIVVATNLPTTNNSIDKSNAAFLQNDHIPKVLRDARVNASRSNILLTKSYRQVTAAGVASQARSMKLKQAKVPQTFGLDQNYPNPFNPTTMIHYRLAKSSHVRLTIWNTLGRRVATLVDQNEQQGTYQVTFNASQLSSGVYFYRLQAGGKVFVKKMMLMK